MTILISKAERDALGINTWERAIIWSSSLLLSAKAKASTDYDANFKIELDENEKTISINIKLPLNLEDYWASMQNYITSVEVISNETVNYTGEPLENNLSELPTESEEINNLERYYIWSCSELKSSYLKNTSNKHQNIVITANPKTITVDTSVLIGYSLSEYFSLNNLLKAINVT